jgi:hypothetical protein
MKFLNSIEIPGGQHKRVELYQGDPTELEAAEAFDLLVISTFPNTYAPTDNALIGALSRKGLSINTLAMNKEVDLRESFSCWLSHEFTFRDTALRFRRILCFEPPVRIFVDRKEINIGSAWQPEIFENLDKCRKVVALLSPDYLSSKMCKEEYNIAWIRSRETDQDIIFPIYLYTAGLPTYMKYRNYFDCREGDKSRIAEASKELLSALEP